MTKEEWTPLMLKWIEEYFSNRKVNFQIGDDKIDIIDKTECDPEDPYANPEVELTINGIKQYQNPEYFGSFYLVLDAFFYLKQKYVE